MTSACSTSLDFSSSTTSTPPHSHPYYATTNHNHNNNIATHIDYSQLDATAYNDALAYLQHSAAPSVNNPPSAPNNAIHHPTPVPATQRHKLVGLRHDSAITSAGVDTHDWQTPMFQSQAYNSVGGPVVGHTRGVKRARVHQRTPSASTVASTGPASPYMQNGSYPLIANTDHAPNSPAFYADQAAYLPKNLPTPSQTPTDSGFANIAHMPSQAAHMPNAHLAMKDFGIGHHTSEDYLSDFVPSRQSMSSYGNDSPATPQSGAGDVDAKQYSIPPNDYRQTNPNVQLFRTESQAFQDELYNPNFVHTSAPSKPANSYLSPHRNLVTERLQTANLARSASPASAMSRERSPFRDGSPLAPARDWRPQAGPAVTAAGMRQQQKDEVVEAEYAQHRATLRREPTKTISPKDAVLDYHEGDQPPLFQDSIPAGYEKHMGGTEQWPTNNYFSQPSNGFGDMSTTGQQSMSFRNATADGYSGAGFDFNTLPQGTDQIQNVPFQANYQAAVQAKMNNFSEPTPNFNPPSMPSMETSISDAGFPQSSQDSGANITPQRPDDTRANTGTYTCTYHGCTQRFGSHNDLQRHKRDYHRTQQPVRDGASTSGTASTSPRSTESPERTGGMTSAAILARNSQAGPHKCTRINPSTNKPCNTIFSRPYDLTRHEDTIHNNRKQKVRCPMCREEKTFSRNDALTRHMRVVHPEVETFGKRGRRSD
ncbi:hypothetical protein M409DRAFT_65011 [Zasmidium cellare ATCC 36951]|uniref:C2H2-type domain-containing protein n=1 Tax=Zasmidium cellare ATCC 36951 TaxID=1080233 RepID=A0A6A6CRI2_ZASCE|nr:uncharacterized protein M409DRAFT_65011 [Zasmidium cellare ATCC 36951]KAF2169303.1 hypothetical protein M409DRAFT_65011 [Zasmidium cellare ATCC 36951]